VTGTVSFNRIPYYEKIAATEGVELAVYSTDPEKKYLDRYQANKNTHAEYILDKGRILEFLQQWKWDCLIAGGYSNPAHMLTYVYSKIRRIPLVLQTETFALNNWISKIGFPAIRLFIRTADAIAAAGTAAKKFQIQCGAAPEDVFIARYVIDNETFCSYLEQTDLNALAEDLNVDDKQVVLFVGKLIPDRGPMTLMRAYGQLAARCDDVALIVVGTGPLEEEMRSYAKKQGLSNVKFVGYVDYPKLASYYGISDVFAFPARYITWGLVLNEAMALGLPVVAFRGVGAAADLVIDGENGFIVEHGDERALCDALIKILSSEETKRAMGRRSKEYAMKEFSLDKSIKEILEVVHYAIKKKKKLRY